MDNKFDFYKDAYFNELNLKDNINNSLSIPIGIIIVLWGALFYLLISFNYDCKVWQIAFFGLFSFTFLISGIISVVYIIKSYSNVLKGHKYGYLPSLDKILAYQIGLKEYAINVLTSVTPTNLLDDRHYMREEEKANKEFEDWLVREMANITSVCQKSNRKKLWYIYRAKIFLVIALISLLITALPYSLNFFISKEDKNCDHYHFYTKEIIDSYHPIISDNSKFNVLCRKKTNPNPVQYLNQNK